MARKIGIGLFGVNGHQIHQALAASRRGRLVAIAAMDRAALPPELRTDPRVRVYPALGDLLEDDRVELVSLCSPKRRDQAADAIRCLEAGRHVYAEKPAALTERDLDRILRVARRRRRHFREMAGTALESPYRDMAAIVAAGRLGVVVQVLVQKSYPMHDGRPQDEGVDGGLTLQVGVHALRMVEQVAGVRVCRIDARETSLGNPGRGGLRMAVSMTLGLENGGVASAIANYLNPRAFGRWGNETLRIFGTRGMVECVDGGVRTHLVLANRDAGALRLTRKTVSHLELYLRRLQGRGAMPWSVDRELHPTRMAIRARKSARRADATPRPCA